MLDLEKALNDFGNNVVKQARANLTRYRIKDRGKLYKDLKFTSKVNKNSIELDFDMPIYGKFQNEGVSGTKKKYDTPYSFKSKQPPSEPISQWAKRKHIRFRDKNGKYKKGNYKSIGFVIARSIKEKGIKPKYWFTKAFESQYKKESNRFLDAYFKDIEKTINFTLKEI